MSLPGRAVLRLKPPGAHRRRRRARVGRARPRPASGDVLTCGRLVLDLDAHLALLGGTPIELSHLQFIVLAHLVRHAGRVVTTTELLAAASVAVAPTSRTAAGTISRLRARLGDAPELPAIEVVRGRGYRLVPREPVTDEG